MFVGAANRAPSFPFSFLDLQFRVCSFSTLIFCHFTLPSYCHQDIHSSAYLILPHFDCGVSYQMADYVWVCAVTEVYLTSSQPQNIKGSDFFFSNAVFKIILTPQFIISDLVRIKTLNRFLQCLTRLGHLLRGTFIAQNSSFITSILTTCLCGVSVCSHHVCMGFL